MFAYVKGLIMFCH